MPENFEWPMWDMFALWTSGAPAAAAGPAEATSAATTAMPSAGRTNASMGGHLLALRRCGWRVESLGTPRNRAPNSAKNGDLVTVRS